MTNMQKQKIIDWFKIQDSPSSLISFFKINKDIKIEIEKELDLEPLWGSAYYFCIALVLDKKIEKCGLGTCNNRILFTKTIHGRQFCSAKCSANCLQTKEKSEKTNLQRYGHKIASQSDNIKTKTERTNFKKYSSKSPLQNIEVQEKSKKTCNERYNNDIFAGSIDFKKRIKTPFLKKGVQDKAIKTKIDRYGIDFGKIIFDMHVDKDKERNLQNYGVNFLLQNKEILSKTQEARLLKYGTKHYWGSEANLIHIKHLAYKKILSWHDFIIPLFLEQEYRDGNDTYKWKCVKCGNEFEQKIRTTGHIKNLVCLPRCLVCYPFLSGFSNLEKEVCDFIKGYFLDTIENSRGYISPLELDIVIPSKKVAIEFDGLIWHSDKFQNDSSYHLNKTKLCNDKGIRLIHIFEDEWVNNQEIVKSRLKAILGIEHKKTFARKCEIREITSKEKNEFLNKYHLQGEDKSKVKIGLFFENELVSVMTFGKPRFNKNYEWELIRFASSKQIIGGASKLLKYFERNYKPLSIITYADKRWSQGNLYFNLGFTHKGDSSPNYWWTKSSVKLSRYECQKHKLKNILGDNFDEKLSENENMSLNGYYKIYDCGNMIFYKGKNEN